MHHANSGVARVIIIIAVIVVLIVAVTAAITLQPKSKPASQPQPSPTASPTPKTSPTATPITTPTASPTHTGSPTAQPTLTPTVPPTSSPSPTPTPTATPTPKPTPTPTPNGNTHTVSYQTMMSGNEIDNWNVGATSGYTVTLNDSMTVNSGEQYLLISGLSGSGSTFSTLWSVTFINSTAFQVGGSSDTYNCVGGIVYVFVNSASTSFVGTSSYTINQPFQSLTEIRTMNGDGTFNSGQLNITISAS